MSYFFKNKSIVVNGRLESSGDAIKLHVEEIIPLEEAKNKLTKKIALTVSSRSHSEQTIIELKNLFEQNIGSIPVFIGLRNKNEFKQFYTNYKIALNDQIVNKINEICGENSIKFLPN